jgi:predicted ABC-type ATPase
MTREPKILIIAGPNGAGKTTFAREYLPQEAACPDFINADLIAAGLSPFQPEAAAMRAGRLVLEEIRDRVQQLRSFAFETRWQDWPTRAGFQSGRRLVTT